MKGWIKEDQKITERHLSGQLSSFLGNIYVGIALVAGQYKIYFPALAFDPPTHHVTKIIKSPLIT